MTIHHKKIKANWKDWKTICSVMLTCMFLLVVAPFIFFQTKSGFESMKWISSFLFFSFFWFFVLRNLTPSNNATLTHRRISHYKKTNLKTCLDLQLKSNLKTNNDLHRIIQMEILSNLVNIQLLRFTVTKVVNWKQFHWINNCYQTWSKCCFFWTSFPLMFDVYVIHKVSYQTKLMFSVLLQWLYLNLRLLKLLPEKIKNWDIKRRSKLTNISRRKIEILKTLKNGSRSGK